MNCPQCSAAYDIPKTTANGGEFGYICDVCRHRFSSGTTATRSLRSAAKPGLLSMTRPVRRIVVRRDKTPGQITGPAGTNGDLPKAVTAIKPPHPPRLLKFTAAAAIIILGSGIFLRDDVVSVIPAMTGLYKMAGIDVNSQGLQFAEITTSTEVLNGRTVLRVEGVIRNMSTSYIAVPALWLQMRTAEKQNIDGWIFRPEQKNLNAGNSMKFTTRLNGPPENVHDIQLEFLTHRDLPGDIR